MAERRGHRHGHEARRQLADGPAGRSPTWSGLDTTKAILETLERELGDAKYTPSPALGELVDAGKLGRKSGAGFYDYGK